MIPLTPHKERDDAVDHADRTAAGRALWRMVVCSVLLGALRLLPAASAAPTCQDCPRYAGIELNFRQDPSLDAPVLRLIPSFSTYGSISSIRLGNPLEG